MTEGRVPRCKGVAAVCGLWCCGCVVPSVALSVFYAQGPPPKVPLPATIWRTSATTAGHEDGTGTGNIHTTHLHSNIQILRAYYPTAMAPPRPGEEPQNRCRSSGPSWQNIGSPRHCGPSNPPGHTQHSSSCAWCFCITTQCTCTDGFSFKVVCISLT